MNKPMTPSEIDTHIEIAMSQAASAGKKEALRKKLFAGLLAGVTLCGETS